MRWNSSAIPTQRALGLLVVGLILSSVVTSRAFPPKIDETYAVTMKLNPSVSPRAVDDSLYFGIASLDSLGEEFEIALLLSLSPDPEGDSTSWPYATRLYTAYFPPSAIGDSVIAAYEADPCVEYAFVDTASVEFMSDPVDGYFRNQWQLRNTRESEYQPEDTDGETDVDAPEAWEFTTGEGVVVAVVDEEVSIDTDWGEINLWVNPEESVDGINNDPYEQDPYQKIDDIHGWDFDENPPVGDSDPSVYNPEISHGTSCAAIIAAKRNGEGLVGVAYSSQLMAIRAQATSSVMEALYYGVWQGVRVFSFSFSPEKRSGAWAILGVMTDVKRLFPGVAIAISAGNGGTSPLVNELSGFPAADSMSVVVGNICYTGMRVASSGFGLGLPTVVAPGGAQRFECDCMQFDRNMRFAVNGTPTSPLVQCESGEKQPRFEANYYTDGWFGGTSAAAPYVAGVLALLFADDESLASWDAKLIIEQSAVDVLADPVGGSGLVGWDQYTGYGVANAHRALLYPWVYGPNGGEEFWGGDTVQVTWRVPKSNETLDLVRSRVCASYDGGTSWDTLATDLSGLDSPHTFEWVAPTTVESEEVLVRVTSHNDNYDDPDEDRYFVSDASDEVFTIHRPLSGTIAADTTWSGRAVVCGDITVGEDETLTVVAGTTVEIANSDCLESGLSSALVELTVNGRLEVDGSATSPVVFDSQGGSKAEGDWYGIRLASGGKGFLTHASVKHAYVGLNFASVDSGLAKQCTFSDNEGEDLSVGTYSGDYVTVDSCAVTIGSGMGIQLTNDGSGVTISNNTLTGSASSTRGIYTLLESGTTTITGNTVVGLTNGEAIRITGGTPVVTRNTLTDCKYGVYSSVGSYTIGDAADTTKRNTITENTTGIQTEGANAAPTIRGNDISSNSNGVVAKSGANPNLGDANQNGVNKFLSNTTHCIWNRNTSGTISARGNYFGVCDGGAPPVCTYGSVDFTGGLCTAPFTVPGVKMGILPPAKTLAMWAVPNPTGGRATLHLGLDGPAEVAVQVYDVVGRLVRELGRAAYGPGEHAVEWDGATAGGRKAPAGIYFVRAIANDRLTRTARVLVVR